MSITLPKDLGNIIAKNLDLQSLVRLTSTNRYWREVVWQSDRLAWRILVNAPSLKPFNDVRLKDINYVRSLIGCRIFHQAFGNIKDLNQSIQLDIEIVKKQWWYYGRQNQHSSDNYLFQIASCCAYLNVEKANRIAEPIQKTILDVHLKIHYAKIASKEKKAWEFLDDAKKILASINDIDVKSRCLKDIAKMEAIYDPFKALETIKSIEELISRSLAVEIVVENVQNEVREQVLKEALTLELSLCTHTRVKCCQLQFLNQEEAILQLNRMVAHALTHWSKESLLIIILPHLARYKQVEAVQLVKEITDPLSYVLTCCAVVSVIYENHLELAKTLLNEASRAAPNVYSRNRTLAYTTIADQEEKIYGKTKSLSTLLLAFDIAIVSQLSEDAIILIPKISQYNFEVAIELIKEVTSHFHKEKIYCELGILYPEKRKHFFKLLIDSVKVNIRDPTVDLKKLAKVDLLFAKELFSLLNSDSARSEAWMFVAGQINDVGLAIALSEEAFTVGIRNNGMYCSFLEKAKILQCYYDPTKHYQFFI